MDILWSAVENLQVVQLTQMLDVKTPGSVAKYLDYFDEVTSVEIFDTEVISEKLMYIPDVDSFSLNFQQAGYFTWLFLANAQGFLLALLMHFSLIFVFLALYVFERRYPKLKSKRKKLRNYLFWKVSIQLFMESYLDIAIFSFMNISEIVWIEGCSGVRASNVLAYIFIILVSAAPLFLAGFAFWRRQKWKKSSFKKRYGSLLEGIKTDKDNAFLVITTSLTFFSRRLILSLTLIYMQNFFWGQIAIQLMISTLLMIFLQWFKPLYPNMSNHL